MLVVSAAALTVAAGGGVIAYVATRGPSAAEKRAHAELLAQERAAAQAALVAADQHQMIGGLTISPAAGTSHVALDADVTVSTTVGAISAVRVVSASGAALSGRLAGDRWVSSGPLLPTTTYTVTVALERAGVTATQTASFSTLTPAATVTANLYPITGMSVGVGQPVVVYFDHDISSPAVQKAIESRFAVAMSSPVPGGWYWFSEHEMHFRPESFWPAHETVAVTADLDGVDLGGGNWLGGKLNQTFTTSDSRISYANLQTEEMTVTEDGHTLYTYPISGGRPEYPTMDGIHIVLDRETVVHMVSSTVGIPVHSPNGYDEYVYDDVHISDSGEYVHAAPWSVGSQGVTNVSHGCINVSPASALTFYNFSRVGDIVEVTGSPRPPAYGDHGVMDWDTPWSQWTPGTVTALSSSTT